MKNINNKKRGFTLVELLLSIGIMGIVVGILGDVFATVIRAYRRAEVFGLTEKNGNFILTKIEQDIRASIGVTVDESTNKITIIKPTSSGTESIAYQFTFCNGSDSGAVTRNGNDLLTSDNPVSNSTLYLEAFPNGNPTGLEPIKRINDTAKYDIVYISFVLSDKCDPTVQNNEGYYQTAVNLRGGIQ